MSKVNFDRARGALLGLAVGDALGTTLEFRDLKAVSFPGLAVGPVTLPIGGGPYDVAPGEVTDDTHMACCLAANLHEFGFFAGNLVVEAYADWMEEAFDIGRQTRAALTAYRAGLTPLEAGFRVWEQSNFNAAGNGSLMRTAPIGVHYAQDPVARRNASIMDSSFTHADPRCSLACAAFNAAIACAVTGATQPEELLAAAEAELPEAAAYLLRTIPGLAAQHMASIPEAVWGQWANRVHEALEQLRSDLKAARRPLPGLDSPNLHLQHHQGFVRVAFRLAFWQLLHRAGFEEALLDTVNRGGDADTNGAITGTLLGAYYGAGAIPQNWEDTVLGAIPKQMNKALVQYHPRVLIAYVEGLSKSFPV